MGVRIFIAHSAADNRCFAQNPCLKTTYSYVILSIYHAIITYRTGHIIREEFIMTLIDYLKKWGLDSVKLTIGFAEMEFKPGRGDQEAAWEMYVELMTRIATQPLQEGDGDEAAALQSVYQLFSVTRGILKENGRKAKQFTRIAIIVLNQIIRPFTARWHKRQLDGAFSDQNSCKTFRQELQQLQVQLQHYAQLLADMAGVEDLTALADME